MSFALDEPELLPRPVLALVLVFPATPGYEERKAKFEVAHTNNASRGDDEPVVWFKQTINNACGLYAILHALCNGPARRFISLPTAIGIPRFVPTVPLIALVSFTLVIAVFELFLAEHLHNSQPNRSMDPPSNLRLLLVCKAPRNRQTPDNLSISARILHILRLSTIRPGQSIESKQPAA
ncbi:ubiquitin carboxyl-terminal hydrolase [Diplogelasinospora grovesii]|uniref:Ubiquitin carboxyl-terminal hydrolase n=1 Tax=Diplogelasinospora grovesii TaxID=303347 RepID=A0AAN6S454_9PEZI|nr:ubiquitin carboxyl-terminal hydrolase [Diplogelasinospora grovesii]